MNVNLDYEFPLAETAIEILGCLRLASRLANPVPAVQSADQVSEQAENIETENQNDLPAKPMKKLDVKEIKISKWTSISDPLDKYIEENENEDASNAEKALRQYLRQSSRMLYDILVTYFNNKWFYISQGKLFTSQDLSTWEYSTNIKITYGGNLYNINNKLIINAHVGQGFISTDGESWQKLNLPQKINDEYIHYDHVIYNNGEWKFIGSYSIKHIEKGFLSDKTHSYASAIIMSTQDFTHFSEFNFVDMFKGYHIKYICGSDNLLCAGIRHKDDSNNQKIIYSKDGISWNIGYICNSSLDFLGIFNNTFIAKIDNICYISTDCIQWEKNELLLNYIGDSCRINYFDKFGFGFIYYNDYCGGQFTIITDEFKLKPLTSPGESPIELFCSTYEKVEFDGKNLVAVFDDHCKVCTLEF
jgi:hypothetical protein